MEIYIISLYLVDLVSLIYLISIFGGYIIYLASLVNLGEIYGRPAGLSQPPAVRLSKGYLPFSSS